MPRKPLPTTTDADTPPWYSAGLKFTCTQCGKCCTGAPGVVWVSDTEQRAIAKFLGQPEHEFVAVFTRKLRGKVSLRERANGDCVFYEAGKGCTIYPVRPAQCRTWPFWDSNLQSEERWQETEGICPGSGVGEVVPLQEIERRRSVVKM